MGSSSRSKKQSGSSGGGAVKVQEAVEENNVEQENNTEKSNALAKVDNGQITNYAQAQKFLNSLGIKPKEPLLASGAWNAAKRTGAVSSSFKNVGSYSEYVTKYCRYAVSEYM